MPSPLAISSNSRKLISFVFWQSLVLVVLLLVIVGIINAFHKCLAIIVAGKPVNEARGVTVGDILGKQHHTSIV